MRKNMLCFCHYLPFFNINFIDRGGNEFNTLTFQEKKVGHLIITLWRDNTNS